MADAGRQTLIVERLQDGQAWYRIEDPYGRVINRDTQSIHVAGSGRKHHEPARIRESHDVLEALAAAAWPSPSTHKTRDIESAANCASTRADAGDARGSVCEVVVSVR